MSDVIDFNAKRKDKLKNKTNVDNYLNIEKFNNFDEIITYYNNIANLSSNINDYSYDVLVNYPSFFREINDDLLLKLINIYNYFHHNYSGEEEIICITLLNDILNNDPDQLFSEESVIINKIEMILNESKEENNIDYVKMVQLTLNNDKFDDSVDIFNYYDKLARITNIDDEKYRKLIENLKFYIGLNKEYEDKITKIFNCLHKRYKNNDEINHVIEVNSIIELENYNYNNVLNSLIDDFDKHTKKKL